MMLAKIAIDGWIADLAKGARSSKSSGIHGCIHWLHP